MLVLGRREGDSILIDGGIRIVVVACDRHGVRLGIEAPSDVKILRGEIADQVASENQRATVAASPSWLTTLSATTTATAVVPDTAPVPAVPVSPAERP